MAFLHYFYQLKKPMVHQNSKNPYFLTSFLEKIVSSQKKSQNITAVDTLASTHNNAEVQKGLLPFGEKIGNNLHFYQHHN